MMMTPSRRKDEPDESGESQWPSYLRWAHIGITITLVLFAIQQYQTYRDDRQKDAIELAVLKEREQKLETINEGQDVAQKLAIENVTKRIDIHRDAIDNINKRLDEHFSQDARRFERAGVR